jgi:hypothetical protein
MNYTVKYDGIKGEMKIEADSQRAAFIKFLEDSVLHQNPIIVSHEDSEGVTQTKTYTEHLDENIDVDSQRAEISAITQREILSQLKQINWAIRIGFLFIMLVISGIIKPGIFSF